MKKIVIKRPGDYRQLKIEEFPPLQAQGNEVVVEVKAAGVNYADVIIRWGLYESAKKFVGWPITPGFEFSGVVKCVGPGVTKFKTGDSVLGVSLFNAYATEVKVSEAYLYPLPEKMSFEEAGAFSAVFLTAYHALFQNVVVKSGMKALIHSAAGGVGSSLVQLCQIAGIETIGVVGSSHKVSYLQKLGCQQVIDKSQEDLWKRVEELAPEGVDLVFDANGAGSFKESFRHLVPCGKLITYGAHTMFPKKGGKVKWSKLIMDYLKTPRFNPLEMTAQNKSVIAFNLSFLFSRLDLFQEGMTDLLRWFEEGKLQAPQVRPYPFHEVGLAHRDLESGQTMGKLILVP